MVSPPHDSPPAATARDKPLFERHLSTLDVTLLGIGAIIGGGIFASLGTAAVGTALRPGAGPSLMLSTGLTALVCALTALCYSELATLWPTAGSAYAYTRHAFGARPAFLIGWCLTLEYAVANVAVALSWGDYAKVLLENAGLPIPLSSRTLGAGIVALLTWLLWRGRRVSSRLTNVLVLIKVAVLLLFVALGAVLITPATMWQHWQPFFSGGARGTLYGSAVIFFSFIGFDAVATVAEEVRAPQRSIPLGIFMSLGICAALYIAVAAVFTGAVPAQELQQGLLDTTHGPLNMALRLFGTRAQFAGPIIAGGALVAQTTALLAFQVAQARIFFAMARDGLLPTALSAVHPAYKTPHIATLCAGLVVGAGTLVSNMDAMLDLTDIGTLFIFCVTNACVTALRRRMPAQPRAFAVPGGAYFVPALGVLSCLALMLILPGQAWIALGGWLLLGYGFDVARQALATVRRRAKAAKTSPP